MPGLTKTTVTVSLCLAAWSMAVAFAGQDRSTADGVYTAAQAKRGEAVYRSSCSGCHGADLSGGLPFGAEVTPPLRRDEFLEGWDLNRLFSYMRKEMPADAPATLTDAAYIDVIAFLLQENAFPPGADELKPDAGLLRAIRIGRGATR